MAVRTQQLAMRVIGFLNPASPEAWENYVAGFGSGLKQSQCPLLTLRCTLARIKGTLRV